MAPKKWTTDEQEEFLAPWYDQYKELVHTRHKQYKIFFANLFEAWFVKFPESVVVFGKAANSPLSAAQNEQLSLAVEDRKEKLRNRFKNYLGSTKAGRQSKASADGVFKAVLASVADGGKWGRNLQETEAYSKLFYEQRLKEQIAQRLGVAGPDLGKQDIQLIKSETRALYAEEPEAVKKQVRDFIRASRAGKHRSEEPPSQMQDSTRNVEMVAAVINQFLTGLNNSTGWAFTLLAGGPAPDAQNDIDCYSFHVGRTPLGNDFSRAYPDFETNIMAPFRDFLYRVYPTTMSNQDGDRVPTQGSSSLSPGANDDGHIAGGGQAISTRTEVSRGLPGGFPSDGILALELETSQTESHILQAEECGSAGQSSSHKAVLEEPESTESCDFRLDGLTGEKSTVPPFWLSDNFDSYLENLSTSRGIIEPAGNPDLPSLPPFPTASPPLSPMHSHFSATMTTTPARTRYLLDSSRMSSSPQFWPSLLRSDSVTTPSLAGPSQPSGSVPSTSFLAQIGNSRDGDGAEDEGDLTAAEVSMVCRSRRSGRIITPATRNTITDSIGTGKPQSRLGKRPRQDDVSMVKGKHHHL